MRACCEAGPSGYELYRQISALGIPCQVIVPAVVRENRHARCAASFSKSLVGSGTGALPHRLPLAVSAASSFVPV